MSRVDQWILIDNLKRKLFLKYELKKKILKSIHKNNNLLLVYRYLAFLKKTKIKKKNSYIKHNNRCLKTGRIWSINTFTSYSRFYLRKEIYSGNLPGFKRISW